MKYIHFIRHGETLMNRKHRHQGPDELLTEKGIKQAGKVALSLRDWEIDTLVSSPFTRARQTAEIIATELDLPISIASSVKEFIRPNALYGKPHHSLASFVYLFKLFTNRDNPRWDNDGAENMFTIRNRIIDAKVLIASTPGTHIAIVSHAIFIDMFVQSVCADRSLSFREFARALLAAKKLPNTGIVTFQVDDTAPPQTCNWWIQTDQTNKNYLRTR